MNIQKSASTLDRRVSFPVRLACSLGVAALASILIPMLFFPSSPYRPLYATILAFIAYGICRVISWGSGAWLRLKIYGWGEMLFISFAMVWLAIAVQLPLTRIGFVPGLALYALAFVAAIKLRSFYKKIRDASTLSEIQSEWKKLGESLSRFQERARLVIEGGRHQAIPLHSIADMRAFAASIAHEQPDANGLTGLREAFDEVVRRNTCLLILKARVSSLREEMPNALADEETECAIRRVLAR